MNVSLKHHEDCTTVLKVDLERNKNWEQWFLLSSDRHHDNIHTNQELEKKHLRECLEKKAGILDFGDLFCAMQGKYDKRSSKSDLREEHQNGRYLDSLVDTSAEFYGPYAKNWFLIAKGNHELSIKERHETCLTSRLVERFKQYESPCVVGGYSGWIIFSFEYSNFRESIRLWYDHGYGGGGPVTKDIIQANRRAVYLPDAEIVVSGHTHDRWIFPLERERISQLHKRYRDTQTHIKTPSYKDTWKLGESWEKTRGHPPKPIGAVWLRFFWSNTFVDYEVTWAK